MSSVLEHTAYADDREDFEQYRALSAPAIVSLLLGFVSLLGLGFAPLLIISVVGTLLSLYAIRTIRRSTELSGAGMAAVGLVLAAGTLAIGGPYHAYVYYAEVPEGYERINFSELQPDPEHPEKPVPQTALDLNGKKVFIKGYVHKLAGTGPLRKFTLVPDMGTCCFGGQPKLTDMIEVHLSEKLPPVFYSYSRRGLSGTLVVHSELDKRDELEGVYYELNVEGWK